MDLYTISLWVLAAAAGLMIYKIIEERRQPALKENIPLLRSAPVCVTKVGLLVMKSKRELSPHKYQVSYEDSGYSPVYYRGDGWDELMPVDPHQVMSGKTRPVYIELEAALELNHRHQAKLKSLYRFNLEELKKKLQNPSIANEDMHHALQQLETMQKGVMNEGINASEVRDKYARSQEKASRRESELRKAESGQEGRIQRRTEIVERIATKSGRNDKERKTSVDG